MFRGKRTERQVLFSVEGDKDNVPDFKNIGVVLIDQMCGVAVPYPVEVNFATRSTRTNCAHLCKHSYA